MITLPAVRRGNQARAMVLGYLLFVALYLGAALVRARAPTLLAGTDADAAIPFIDWTIWVYLSQFVLLPIAIVQARDDALRSRVFYALLLATLIAASIFIAWPTEIARPVVAGGGPTAVAWKLLHLADVPTNCFPSLHVALASIGAVSLWQRGWRAVALVWPAAIALSTLTTRQHVLWDIAGGVVLAVLAWNLVPRIVRHDHAQAADNLARG